MSKAILVLDEMPKSCFECELCEQRDAGDFFCASTGDPDGVGYEKPDWCPLREMPEPMYLQSGDYMEYNEGCIDGWNNCLAKLEGKRGKSNFSSG